MRRNNKYRANTGEEGGKPFFLKKKSMAEHSRTRPLYQVFIYPLLYSEIHKCCVHYQYSLMKAFLYNSGINTKHLSKDYNLKLAINIQHKLLNTVPNNESNGAVQCQFEVSFDI